MTSSTGPTQSIAVKYLITASYKEKPLRSRGKRIVRFQRISNQPPYFFHGSDYAILKGRTRHAVHFPPGISEGQDHFNIALAFFSSSVRNNIFRASKLQFTPDITYVNSLVMPVSIDGTEFTYVQRSSSLIWTEKLALEGHEIARSTGELTRPG
jgi:hypothetical protein